MPTPVTPAIPVPPFMTSDLLTAVMNRGMFPTASSGSLSPAAILEAATEEFIGGIVPKILSVREKYYETYQDTVVIANQSVYPVPLRAIGGILSAVQYIYNKNIIPIEPLDPVGVTTTVLGLTPRGYYFENGNIVMFPGPSQAVYTIRMRYFQRPSKLEQIANCAQITAFDPVAMTVTVSSLPSTWIAGNQIDFIPMAPTYTAYGTNSVIQSISGNILQFLSLPSSIAIGDWIGLAGWTPIPEIPEEFFPVLVQATLCKCLEALGDQVGLQAASASLQTKIQNAVALITPREQLGQKKVTSNWRNW